MTKKEKQVFIKKLCAYIESYQGISELKSLGLSFIDNKNNEELLFLRNEKTDDGIMRSVFRVKKEDKKESKKEVLN